MGKFVLTCCGLLLCSVSQGQEPANTLKDFQGNWEVVELVEDGKTVPRQAIQDWLPSGGKIQIAQNAIIFESPGAQKKSVKLFSVNVSTYPKQIDVSTQAGVDGTGIYRFDDEKLIVCMTSAQDGPRPDSFSAEVGSKRMLMILARDQKTSSPPQEPAPQTPLVKSATKPADSDVAKLLVGMWKYRDAIGNLFVSFNPNGTFSTTREVEQVRVFQKVFVQTPVSTGTWRIQSGKIAFVVQTSNHWDRVNKQFEFAVRSITPNDMVFVDYLGQAGRAVKVSP